MVPIYSQQLAQRLFMKLVYMGLLTTLLCTTVFFARGASQISNNKLSVYDKLAPKDFLSGLFTTKETRNWKQHYSPVYLAKTKNQCQSAPSQKWRPSRKERRSFINNWSKHLPESRRTSRGIANWQNDLPDHPGQSRQSRIWIPPLQPLLLSGQSQNMKFLNMPPEISPGDMPLSNIQFLSKTCCYKTSKHARRKTNYWVRKSGKSYSRTTCWPHKLPTSTIPRLKN